MVTRGIINKNWQTSQNPDLMLISPRWKIGSIIKWPAAQTEFDAHYPKLEYALYEHGFCYERFQDNNTRHSLYFHGAGVLREVLEAADVQMAIAFEQASSTGILSQFPRIFTYFDSHAYIFDLDNSPDKLPPF